MKSFTLSLFIPVLLLAFCPGCMKTKCNQREIAHLTFTEEDLSINPYNGNEVLYFKSTDRESVVFSNGSRITKTYQEFKYDVEDAKEYHDGCRGDFFSKEYDYTDFRAQNDSNRMSVTLSNTYSFYQPQSVNYINLFFETSSLKGWGFSVSFEFRNDSLVDSEYMVDTIVAYHDQVTIGPKSYTGVIEIFAHQPLSACTEWFSTGYYSIKEGFVGFRTNTGITWYLDKKE